MLGVRLGVECRFRPVRTPTYPQMPKKIAPLTDARCRNAKPGSDGRMVKLFDGGGLYLQVTSSGSRLWRLKYRFAGTEKLLSLGPYPDVSLASARDARQRARTQLQDGTDPSANRQADRAAAADGARHTLESIAREWHSKQSPGWASSHADKVLLRLEKNIFPWLGKLPIASVTAPMILSALQRVEDRSALDTARRLRQYLNQVFRFAIQTSRAKHNVAADLVGATATPVAHKYASIQDPEELGRLLRDMDCYAGSLITRTALKLAPMLFCRPGELRGMQWSELNLDKAEWRIPPHRQKLKQRTKLSNRVADIIFPLPRQAVELLRDLQPLTGTREHVFPSERTPSRSMSDGTVNAALRRMGYGKAQITGHGFRHTASTMLNEQNCWSPDAIEAQLSHKDPNTIRGIYNGAKYLEERTRMMQAWADHLDTLAAKAKLTSRQS